ncbi:MAG: Lrp/AsnC family transcriptional regulator [Thermoproteota archaeon]|jgi:DNA-binding Lrp family transcriptional regulator|nr:Lrp/AsnC family transcriptional regulator [Thermoproteota archaeon]
MTSALVFINCHFPFNDAVIKELGKLQFVSDVYRTGGIYDIIVRVNSLTENALRGKIIRNIRSIKNVNSTMTMVIAEGK